MTLAKIKKYYKVSAVAGIVFGLIFILIVNSISLSERIVAAIVVNAGFHLFYFFISKVPIAQLKWMKRNNSPFTSSKLPAKFIASAAIAMSFLMSYFFLQNVIEIK